MRLESLDTYPIRVNAISQTLSSATRYNKRWQKARNALSGWRSRMGWLMFMCHFPKKSPVIIGSFVESDVQLGARQKEGILPLGKPLAVRVGLLALRTVCPANPFHAFESRVFIEN